MTDRDDNALRDAKPTAELGNRVRQLDARRAFRRSVVYLAIAGVLMVAATLVYLASDGPLTTTLVVVATGGVFVSVMLGGGLMAVGFFSSSSGIDEQVAAATDSRSTTDAG